MNKMTLFPGGYSYGIAATILTICLREKSLVLGLLNIKPLGTILKEIIP